jgi:hypothetical protein
MRLQSVPPGVTVDQVQTATGFELIVPDDVLETAVPRGDQVWAYPQRPSSGSARSAVAPVATRLGVRVR